MTGCIAPKHPNASLTSTVTSGPLDRRKPELIYTQHSFLARPFSVHTVHHGHLIFPTLHVSYLPLC